jgi:hypothetical protein
MDLTNLIWHLGSALAALWAGFAYRALRAQYTEFRQAVMGSLMPETPLHQKSLRVRSLRWILDEFVREHDVQLDILSKKELLLIEQSEWTAAILSLLSLVSRNPKSSILVIDESGQELSAENFMKMLKETRGRSRVLRMRWHGEAKIGGGRWQCLFVD